METITISKPVPAHLFVVDRDPFAGATEEVNLGQITVDPGTYDMEEVSPSDPAAGIARGCVVIMLGMGAFAEIDEWYLLPDVE